jgi:hypothetical protein
MTKKLFVIPQQQEEEAHSKIIQKSTERFSFFTPTDTATMDQRRNSVQQQQQNSSGLGFYIFFDFKFPFIYM